MGHDVRRDQDSAETWEWTMDQTVQPDHAFSHLVFEGGGVKGVAYCGALQVLEERGILQGVKGAAGTSAGAITAALVALGFQAPELTKTMLALDFTRFEDGKWEGPARLVEDFGWYRGDAFLTWMEDQVEAALHSRTATFADLSAARGVDLRVVATDLVTRKPEVFSAATSPDVGVARAVRMSMSIPLFFAAVRDGDRLFVDGGVAWNYPVEIFDDVRVDARTLGFRLEWPGHAPEPRPITGWESYAKGLYDSLLQVQADFYERSAADVGRSVIVSDLGFAATDFSISHQQKLELITQGADATRHFLDARA